MPDDYEDDDQAQGAAQGDSAQVMAQAAPEDVDAHRGLLSEVMGQLGGQGVNVQSLLGQAGVGTTDPSQMSHGDLAATTMALAREHPEVMTEVANRFPAAGGLLSDVLGAGGQSGAGGGGMLGGLLGRFGL